MTYFFTLTTKDIYGNLEISSYDTTEIEIIAEYVDHINWPSPIGIPDITNWA